MTLKQTQAVVKILDQEYRKRLKDQLRIHALATHADRKKLLNLIK